MSLTTTFYKTTYCISGISKQVTSYSGRGVDVTKDEHDCYNVRSVIKPLHPSKVEALPIKSSKIETCTTLTSHAVSYVGAGRPEAGLAIESPSVSGNGQGDSLRSSYQSENSSQIFVVGRWAITCVA
jgi:hypothetical protein